MLCGRVRSKGPIPSSQNESGDSGLAGRFSSGLVGVEKLRTGYAFPYERCIIMRRLWCRARREFTQPGSSEKQPYFLRTSLKIALGVSRGQNLPWPNALPSTILGIIRSCRILSEKVSLFVLRPFLGPRNRLHRDMSGPETRPGLTEPPGRSANRLIPRATNGMPFDGSMTINKFLLTEEPRLKKSCGQRTPAGQQLASRSARKM